MWAYEQLFIVPTTQPFFLFEINPSQGNESAACSAVCTHPSYSAVTSSVQRRWCPNEQGEMY
jgi:hypothetical protein